jgi:hypothetical protein
MRKDSESTISLTVPRPADNDAMQTLFPWGKFYKLMRNLYCLAVLIGLFSLNQATMPPVFAEENGLALAIIYDTSGSMKETVRDRSGKAQQKYIIANRALKSIASRIEVFAKSKDAEDLKVQVALFIFQGREAQAAISLGAFDAKAFTGWAEGFRSPRGDTPLGNAVQAAGFAVLDSTLSRKHVLVITDGLNTVGPQPAATLPKVQQRAQQRETTVAFHFVAFDIDAKVFEPLKKLGATVVGAADEAQLNTQLDYILEQKILLEEEEPKPVTKP